MKELPTTSQFIKKYGLDAKKSLGQNFILDKNFTDKIAKTAISEGKDDLSEEVILEVGPGPASLTRSILDLNPKKLMVIEKDRRCLKILEELPKETQILVLTHDEVFANAIIKSRSDANLINLN